MGPRSPERGRSALCRVRVVGTMPGGGPGPCARGRDDGRAVASHRGRGAGRGDRTSRWSTSAAAPTPPRAGGRRRIARHVPSRTPLRRAHTRIRLGYGADSPRVRPGRSGRSRGVPEQVSEGEWRSRPPRPRPGEAFGPRPWPRSPVSRPPPPVLHVSRLPSLVCRRARRGTSRPGRGHAAVRRRPSPSGSGNGSDREGC